MEFRWLYDAFGLFYATSLVLFFIDAFQPRRAINRTALILLFVVFCLETVFLLGRLDSLGYVPIYSAFDSMLLFSWLIVLIALVVNAFFRLDLVLIFANLIGFSVVLFDSFAREELSYYTNPQGDLLILHISMALLSYVAFTFAFAFSLMYLIQDRLLRRKQWLRWFFRLPSLERLDLYMFRSILVGYPLLLVAIVLGVIWSEISLGMLVWRDPKFISTILLFFMYGIYLLLRVRAHWAGRKLMWYSVVCYAGVILNYVIVGSFSPFHR
ncbi:MAG: hypothetical protein A2201_10800 [Alicyclobacillus sp. RIFOXYA1_FULL_53_8]|nr:MAG: hypothetical protein A2201_10800 [Alicyclobacillus sp. RIFOXYA1_FULL_53_8]